MRHKLIIIFTLFIIGISINFDYAQNREIIQKSADSLQINRNNWKFGVGVTLLQSKYSFDKFYKLERQPLEFDFRYKIDKHNVLQLDIPILWKTNKHGQMVVSTSSTLADIPLEDCLKKFQETDFSPGYIQTLQYYESMYGVSVGYDYNFPIKLTNFSSFAGINFGCYDYQVKFKIQLIQYANLGDEYLSKLSSISLFDFTRNLFIFKINPTVGIRYTFQKLLFEGSIGYCYFHTNGTFQDNAVIIYTNDYIDNRPEKEGYLTSLHTNQLSYKISLYYTF